MTVCRPEKKDKKAWVSWERELSVDAYPHSEQCILTVPACRECVGATHPCAAGLHPYTFTHIQRGLHTPHISHVYANPAQLV